MTESIGVQGEKFEKLLAELQGKNSVWFFARVAKFGEKIQAEFPPEVWQNCEWYMRVIGATPIEPQAGVTQVDFAGEFSVLAFLEKCQAEKAGA